MIHELQRRDFRIVEQIIPSKHDLPEVLSVVRGMSPGRVFVDNTTTPCGALVWSQGIEGFYVIVNAESPAFFKHLDGYVQKAIIPQMKSLGLDCFEISGDDSDLDENIERIFASQTIKRSHQCVYRSSNDLNDSNRLISLDSKKIRRIDSDLLSDPQLENRKFLHSKLSRFWSDHDLFLSAGIGFAIIEEQAIASLCFSAFVAESTHVVDVETVAAFQNNGFAEMVAIAFLQECSRRRFNLYWDCMSTNSGSRRLAEKIGLAMVRKYTLYSFQI